MARDEGYCFYEDSLPEWGISTILLAEDSTGDLFYPVRTICEALRLDRSTQNAIVREDSRTKGGTRDIKAPTKGGRQETLYLRKRETAIWLANIDPWRVNGIARGQLEDFQAALWSLAERTVFRRHTAVHAGAEEIGPRPLPGHCPVCGAAIKQDPATAVYVRVEE